MAQQLKTLDVSALLELRGRIDALLSAKRRELEAALAAFGGDNVGHGKPMKVLKVNGLNGRKGKRAKAPAKYQSKKDKSVKWSGRGMTPIWMRAEMKGTKLEKDDFLIR